MDNTRIPLSAFETSFQLLGTQVDVGELECILATLIYNGYIKGYISHQKKFLVTAKADQDPFPKLSSVIRK